MFIRSLVLSQFRVWDYQEYSFDARFTYITGPNGSGKTSLLEAIRYLSTGRSFRTHRDGECVNWDTSQFSLRGEFGDSVLESLSLAYRGDASTRHKIARVDGETLPRLSEFQGRFPTVLFSPQHLRILEGGPGERRQFLNELISTLDPSYMSWLKKYEESYQQRNQLLKASDPDALLLESYEERMVESGQRLLESRRDVLEDLEPPLTEHFRDLYGVQEADFALEYRPSPALDREFGRVLEQERPRARQRGYTTVGPQRDDWMMLWNGRAVDRFASRGQLRILLLSLKFAEVSIIINMVGDEPVLLLDDLISELDEERSRVALTRAYEKPYQVLVTGTRPLPAELSLTSEQVLALKAR